MKNILLVILVVLVLIYLYLNYKNEHLYFTENDWMSLEEQEASLKRLDGQYYNSVADDEVITNDYNARDNLAYELALTT
jgi:uncharacterized protein YxeA